MRLLNLRSFAYGFLCAGTLFFWFEDDFCDGISEGISYLSDKDAPIPYGAPQGHFIFVNQGFIGAYDGARKIPLWIYEEVTSQSLEKKASRKGFDFQQDNRLPKHLRAFLEDYRGSGYDRGHLAPAGNHRSSKEELEATFFLTNIAPQDHVFNTGIWKQLEDKVRKMAATYHKVHVVTGPLFSSLGKRVQFEQIGKNKVGVPTHFYKVILVEREDHKKQMTAFVIPNKKTAQGPLSKFQTTLQEVETLSGLIFFPEIPEKYKHSKKYSASLLGG